MKISRKVLVAAVILGLSLVAVSAKPGKATIHVQTLGYEGRDVLKLNVEISGEDSDYLFFSVNAGVINKVKKEINVEKLPVVQIDETMFKVPKSYLTEIGENEYVIVVPNDVTKMKWNIKDKIKEMNGNDIVRVLVWFKEIGAFSTLNEHGTVYYEFLSGMGAAMDIRVSNIKALSEEGAIEFVEADEIRHVNLSQSVPLINADDCWSAGWDGTGVKICIIDTGIEPCHCDFLSEKIVAWVDYVGNCPSPYDDHGHGTHCASIAAGEDDPKGVAPGASLMVAKVCTSGGSCSDSAIIAGVDFGVAQGADVESLSLSGPGGDGTSALAQECNWAVNQGVVVCVAAGNDGSACCTIGTPGDAANVITVAASDKSDGLASFSSRGPTTDDRIKPDIAAPGVSIYAAARGTSCGDTGMSGTSMATPHIAGVAALMLDANGSATPLQVKHCMGATAIDKGNTNKDCLWGWGRVDAYAACQQIVSNPNVSPPPDGTCGCECGWGSLLFPSSSTPLPSFSSPLSFPNIVIASPVNGEEVWGTVDIIVCARGCIDTVEFYIDGEYRYTDTPWPFTFSWDTNGETGTHTIKVEAYYSGQFIDSDEITVEVIDGCIVITDPQDEETVSCNVLITTSTSEEVNAVKFYINGVARYTDSYAPFQFLWDTCDESNGTYTIRADAYGDGILAGSGNVLDVLICSDEIEVQVNNPCIKITNPQDGEYVYGLVEITTDESCCINEVRFYIDGELKFTDFEPDYKYNWPTTDPEYIEDQPYTITIEGYYHGVLKCTDSITVIVDNFKITNPQDGEDVSGTVLITVDARGIDIVQFYIGDYCLGTDCEAPFEYEWDTTGYGEDEPYTICVKGFTNEQIPNCSEQSGFYSGQPEIYSIEPKATDCITITVNNIYVRITDPQEGEQVSGTFLITTETRGVDSVKFYIDDINNPCECEDMSEPFECSWDTTSYEDGGHTIIAQGYASGEFQDQDTVTCNVCNGSTALFLGIFFGVAGITIRKH